ncbi:MAG: DUF2064 domain-containing protein [candidate division KSB1 bacterium]
MRASLQNPNRAILLFTRSPENEARLKPLSAKLSFAERVGLYESFTRHVLAQACALDYPILVATDEPEYNFARYSPNVATVFKQRGDSFGNKLAHAFQTAFAQGYDEIVCVGNDCLELSAADLNNAFAQLATQALVLGGANDGGVYLIGLRRESLGVALRAVHECHWQTAIVLSDLLASARQYGIATGILRTRGDLDTADEVMRAGNRLRHLAFLKRYSMLLARACGAYVAARALLPRTSHFDPLRFQKAPPAFLR